MNLMAIKKRNLKNEQSNLNYQLKHEGVLVDNLNILPVSLTPYHISFDKYQHLHSLCKSVISAIEKFLRLYVDNQDVQDLFPELNNFRSLSCIKPNYDHWIHLARFDVVETQDSSFKILETNCDCPGAILFAPIIKKIYKTLNISSDNNFTDYYQQPLDDEDFFVKSLLKSYKAINPSCKSPNLAFLSSNYRKITSDLNLLEKIGKKLAINCKHISVQDLNTINGRICFDNTPVDLVYQKFDAFIDENHQAKPCIYDKYPSEVKDYLAGIYSGKIVNYNSFPSSLVAENKRILAFLIQPEFQKYFTAEENKAINTLCPKTYSLAKKSKNDKVVEEFIKNKNHYVIKRTIDTRGRGVWIGSNCNKNEWANLVNKAFTEPYIIQEYISHKKSQVFDAADNPQLVDMYTNLAMFIIAGEPSGLIARASKDIITNIGKSGCIRPVFVHNKG